MSSPSKSSPLHLSVSVVKLPKDGMPIRFEASPEEREALAKDIGIVSVESLEADLTVASWKRDGISVRGRFSATILQESVVTLEPVGQVIDEAVDILFLPENSRLARMTESQGGELFVDPEGDDLPESFNGDRIDLGPYLAELLVLGLDPYPRRSDEAFEARNATEIEEKPSAFAVLRQLRNRSDAENP